MFKNIMLIILTILLTVYFVNKEVVVQSINNEFYKKLNFNIDYKKYDTNYINTILLNGINLNYQNNKMGTIKAIEAQIGITNVSLILYEIESDLTFLLPGSLKHLKHIELKLNYIDYNNINLIINKKVNCIYQIKSNVMKCDKYQSELNNLFKVKR